MGKTASICCVVEDLPRLHVELVLWTICVRSNLPKSRYCPIAYFVGREPTDLVDWVRDQGVETRRTTTLVDGSPHCNKIIPFRDANSASVIAVSDVDLFFVADPSELFSLTRFRAPPNNHCNPPPFIWTDVLRKSGLGRPYRPGIALFPQDAGGLRETHINNVSAGLVTAPAGRSLVLAQAWEKWARWLVANRSLLQSWAVHVDQIGFALALEEMGEDVEVLPPQTNTILHLIEAVETIYAFHLTTGHIPQFPERFAPDKTLNPEGLRPGAALAAERLNGCIREAVEVISELPSTREHLDKFLNPNWKR